MAPKAVRGNPRCIDAVHSGKTLAMNRDKRRKAWKGVLETCRDAFPDVDHHAKKFKGKSIAETLMDYRCSDMWKGRAPQWLIKELSTASKRDLIRVGSDPLARATALDEGASEKLQEALTYMICKDQGMKHSSPMVEYFGSGAVLNRTELQLVAISHLQIVYGRLCVSLVCLYGVPL